MTSLPYPDNLVPLLCTVADVYDTKTIYELTIEELDRSLSHSQRHEWVQDPQAHLFDIAFWTKSLLNPEKAGSTAQDK